MKGLDGMREEGTGNLLGNKGRGVTSGEEELGEVSGIGHLGDCRCAALGWPESKEWSV